ncbi:hypothetical protein BD779DRAFT_1668718 [Infundibulicybe gibba]|nr:hypothetical protein BD779DRAFT_1668718 [Infundibulicybe gibba]
MTGKPNGRLQPSAVLILQSRPLTHASLYVYLILQYPWTPAGIVDVSSTFCAQFGLSALAILIIQTLPLQMRRANNYGLLAGFIGSCPLDHSIHEEFLIPFLRHLYASEGLDSSVIMTAAQALVSLAALGTPVSLFYLRRRSRAKPITNLFDIFLSYAFDHGVLTTLVQLGFCVVFAAMPSRVLWMPFQFMATKLFVNSFLSQLNSREKFQGRGVAHGIKTPSRPGRSILLNDNALSMPTIQFTDHPNSVVRAGPGAEPFWHKHNGEPVDKRLLVALRFVIKLL